MISSSFSLEMSKQNRFDNQISLINAFSGCSIQVINFHGIDINFKRVYQPLILLRYFSFPRETWLYPIEMSPQKTDEILGWLTIPRFVEFKKTRTIHFKNKSFLFDTETSQKYLKLLLNKNLKISIKNTNCNANIYIQPPHAFTSSHFYFRIQYLGDVLKDPFWTVVAANFENQKGKQDYINTVPNYSLLMHHPNPSHATHDYGYKQRWINAVLGYPRLVTKTEMLLVWEMSSNGSRLYIFCPYCNACSPFEMISVKSAVSDFKFHLKNHARLVAGTHPRSIEIITRRKYTTEFLESMKNGKSSPKPLLKYINNFHVKDNSNFVPLLLDIHALQNLFSNNISLNFRYKVAD